MSIMTPDVLCTALRAALDETEQWTRAMFGEASWERARGRQNLSDRASVLRRVAADRRVLDRHQLTRVPHIVPGMPVREWCATCDSFWPCVEFVDLADRYGITTEDGEPA